MNMSPLIFENYLSIYIDVFLRSIVLYIILYTTFFNLPQFFLEQIYYEKQSFWMWEIDTDGFFLDPLFYLKFSKCGISQLTAYLCAWPGVFIGFQSLLRASRHIKILLVGTC